MEIIPDTPFVEALYRFINTPGLGGLVALLLGGGSVTAYALTLHWIRKGAEADEQETYVYPTPALHHHGE